MVPGCWSAARVTRRQDGIHQDLRNSCVSNPFLPAFGIWSLIKISSREATESISPARIQTLGYQHPRDGRGIYSRFFALMELTAVALCASTGLRPLAVHTRSWRLPSP